MRRRYVPMLDIRLFEAADDGREILIGTSPMAAVINGRNLCARLWRFCSAS